MPREAPGNENASLEHRRIAVLQRGLTHEFFRQSPASRLRLSCVAIPQDRAIAESPEVQELIVSRDRRAQYLCPVPIVPQHRGTQKLTS